MAGKEKISCVALISGGLDSTLASAIIKAQGIEVLGVFFLHWLLSDRTQAESGKRRRKTAS